MLDTIKTLYSQMKKNVTSEKGEIGDSFMIIIAIGLSVVLIFIFPLMTMADRADDVSQLAVQSAVSDFAEKVRTTGKITEKEYSQLIETVTATGNTYDVEMNVQVKDINVGKKTSVAQHDKTGEDVYYTVYQSQIEDAIYDDSKGAYYLKAGDIFSISLKNASPTLAEQLKNFFYTAVGNNAYTIAAESTVVCLVDGN